MARKVYIHDTEAANLSLERGQFFLDAAWARGMGIERPGSLIRSLLELAATTVWSTGIIDAVAAMVEVEVDVVETVVAVVVVYASVEVTVVVTTEVVVVENVSVSSEAVVVTVLVTYFVLDLVIAAGVTVLMG